jgi:hypothetical protein
VYAACALRYAKVYPKEVKIMKTVNTSSPPTKHQPPSPNQLFYMMPPLKHPRRCEQEQL